MKSLVNIAFQSWLVTVLILLFIEWQIPGFVSFVIPVYWLIILLIVLGLLGSTRPVELATGSIPAPVNEGVRYIIAALVGLVLFGIILAEGEIFSFMRIPFALTALFFPLMIVYFYKVSP